MPPMVMTQEDRERLAARLIREERVRFSGIAKDAYNAAGVNPATWKRATEAQTIKPHKLIQIVKALWPETVGDWTLIPDLDSGSGEGPGRLADLIETYLSEHPMSDVEMAAHVGVDIPTIKAWRTRRIKAVPDADLLRRLAEVLGLEDVEVFDAVLIDAGFGPRRGVGHAADDTA